MRCSRPIGSSKFDDARPLAPWLFRIAHNRCIDFLRRRGVRQEAETAAMAPDSVRRPIRRPDSRPGGRAPRDGAPSKGTRLRAAEGCLRLLSRRRSRNSSARRWAASRPRSIAADRNWRRCANHPAAPRAAIRNMSQLLHLYVERFNRRDWDGLRELISADARLRVADRSPGGCRCAVFRPLRAADDAVADGGGRSGRPSCRHRPAPGQRGVDATLRSFAST